MTMNSIIDQNHNKVNKNLENIFDISHNPFFVKKISLLLLRIYVLLTPFYVPTDSLQNESCHKFMHICCSKNIFTATTQYFILEMDRTVSY